MSKIDPRPTVKAVCTKISKKFFFAYLSIFLYFWEKIMRYHFSYFEYLSKNSPKLNQNCYWLWVYFGISVSNGQIRITVLNYTVLENFYQGLTVLLGNLAFIVIGAALKTKSLFRLVVSEQVSKAKKGFFSCNFAAQNTKKPGGFGLPNNVFGNFRDQY